jgi:hypothetical protein
MLQDLWIKHREWVFEPILARKAETMRGEHIYLGA